MRGAVAADGVNGVWLVALGREGIGRAGREDDEVGAQPTAGRQDDPVSIDVHGPVAQDSAVGEQLVVGQEDPGQPGRFDQGPQRRDIVHESVFGLNQGDLGVVGGQPAAGREASIRSTISGASG